MIQTGLDIIGENEILNASLGYVYVQFVNVGVSIDEKYLKKAEENVKKAFSINKDSSLAHSVMGQIHWKRGVILGEILQELSFVQREQLQEALHIQRTFPLSV